MRNLLSIWLWLCFWYTHWSAEEILLENVELILEAFDYLQLPFALKNGIDFLIQLYWFSCLLTIAWL